MDREELLAIWAMRDSLENIGAGSYNTVCRVSANIVVKFSKGIVGSDETTWDYMQWCHLRLLSFGARSPEMVGFPIVLGVLNEPDMRMAVMMRCRPFEPYINEVWQSSDEAVKKHASRALKTLCKVFSIGRYPNGDPRGLDLHSGNIMWCSVRGCLVLNDPFYDGERKSNGTQPTIKVKKPKAQWLRPGLKNLYPGARC